MMQQDPAFVLANLEEFATGLPQDVVLKIKEQASSTAAKSSGDPDSCSSRFAVLQRVKAKRPLSALEDVEYASAALHLHRYDEALWELMNSRRADTVTQYWLFRVCESLGKDELKQTVKAHPDSLRLHLLLADFAIQRDDFLEAHAEYQAALALAPHAPEIRLLNVHLLETERKAQEALKEAIGAIGEFPYDAGLNFEAGDLSLRASNDAAAAARYLEQSLKTDPSSVQARVDLADAYGELDRPVDAIREINKVLNTDDDGTLYYHLARWYRQTGQTAEAANALEFSRKIKQRKFQSEVKAAAPQASDANGVPPK